MSFGAKLKAIRTKNKLSMKKVGEEIGVSKATIWQWEGIITNPENIKTKNMDALCQFFDVPKEYFFDNNSVHETATSYATNKKAQDFNDVLSKAIKYVLDNAGHLNNADTTIACRLLYNRVKDKEVILVSDLKAILKLLH